jgi:hypothetical protein
MFYRIFSLLLYILSVVDIILIVCFFYRLSLQNSYESTISFYDIGFSVWGDCLGWIFFTFISSFLHYYRKDFENEFSNQFELNNVISLKLLRVFFCDIVAFFMVVGIFRNFVLWSLQLR